MSYAVINYLTGETIATFTELQEAVDCIAFYGAIKIRTKLIIE